MLALQHQMFFNSPEYSLSRYLSEFDQCYELYLSTCLDIEAMLLSSKIRLGACHREHVTEGNPGTHTGMHSAQTRLSVHDF